MKLVVVGNFPPIETAFNGEPIYGGILRLNPDGSWDRSFATTSDRIYTAALQPDGKIIIGGAWTSTNLVKRANISRLNTDGTLDPTFNPGPGTDYDLERAGSSSTTSPRSRCSRTARSWWGERSQGWLASNGPAWRDFIRTVRLTRTTTHPPFRETPSARGRSAA